MVISGSGGTWKLPVVMPGSLTGRKQTRGWGVGGGQTQRDSFFERGLVIY